jgi:hypothetical protein
MMKILQVIVFMTFYVNLAIAADKPADYAYGIALEATGSEAFYDVTLPPAVYRGVTRADLSDVRMFNGAGEIVPHAWRPRRTTTADALPPVTLTLFPLMAPVGVNVDNMSIKLRRSASGAVRVDVQSSGVGVAVATTTVGYLVDISSQERTLRAIEFDWSQPPDGFAGKLRIDASNDLSSWRSLVSSAPLVRLEVAGQRLQQKRVELPRYKAKYLRIAWVSGSGARAMPELTAASAELAEKFVEAQREWQKFSATKGEKPGEYTFDTHGHFPVDRVRIDPPEVNTIVQVELLARDHTEQPWRSVTRGVAYRLRQSGGEVVSPELAVTSRARYWLLRVDQRGGGLGNGMPELNVGWVPHQLVFAARGVSPFQMAYGNRDAKPAAYAIETLLPGYRDNEGGNVRVAKTGTQIVNVSTTGAQSQTELGGEARLANVIDWKRWSLWGALLLGVLVLGAMAWRLIKQLGSAPVPRKDDVPHP